MGFTNNLQTFYRIEIATNFINDYNFGVVKKRRQKK